MADDPQWLGQEKDQERSLSKAPPVSTLLAKSIQVLRTKGESKLVTAISIIQIRLFWEWVRVVQLSHSRKHDLPQRNYATNAMPGSRVVVIFR